MSETESQREDGGVAEGVNEAGETAAGQAEQVAAEPSSEALQAEVEKLRAELEAKERRLDEVMRAYSGLLNDQKDFRNRLEREKARVLENEKGNVALVLLEVADELDRALAASEDQMGPLAKGVRLVHEGLHHRLQRMGIERIPVVGKPFDPNVAEAIDLEVVDDPEKSEIVLAEAVAGYRLGSRLLRAAKVKVARYVPQATGSGDDDAGAPSDESAQG